MKDEIYDLTEKEQKRENIAKKIAVLLHEAAIVGRASMVNSVLGRARVIFDSEFEYSQEEKDAAHNKFWRDLKDSAESYANAIN